ncbi:SRPBCC family protein [Lipingzhangella sp. LS1_29]|uniref:SRPBCC family protein n=1 Tax=Lipingzhangella rawalii TaxID=2055835 RepID=A0ABU2H3J1_9ACTN|nr:SRPBCC family protein [Lipingzhangella rawalii]MDS1269866.1 SRPBCC family protein [Lipingzhangella rawalii]
MSTRLDNEFTVPVPVDDAWRTLLDVQRVAPCMPGASLESVDDDGSSVTGRVRVKVGPVTVTYRGTATFVETDSAARSVLVDARGKEARGSGTAEATVRATLHDQGDRTTRVRVETNLSVTGKAAQFGRGVIADVSAKLVDRFAQNLAAQLTDPDTESETASGAAAPTGEPQSGPTRTGRLRASRPYSVDPAAANRTDSSEETTAAGGDTDALDALDLAAGPVLRRLLPLAGGLMVVAAVVWWLRCRRRESRR